MQRQKPIRQTTFSILPSSSLLAFLLAFAISMTLPNTVFGQVYRYKDDSGNVVLNRTIPPRFVPKGYEILNDKGRVIQTVPPALTPEQIAARDAERERQKREEAKRLKQAEYDYALRQLYSHPNDAVRVLARRLQDIDGVIQLKRAKIDTANKSILEAESRAADIQRKGMPVPDNILQKIQSMNSDIENAVADIKELQKERIKVIREFDAKIQRLETLTKKQASDYPALKEKITSPSQNTPTPESGIE